MTDPTPTAEVSITVTVGTDTKTFTARAETTGDPTAAARGLISSVTADANNWTWDARKAVRRVETR